MISKLTRWLEFRRSRPGLSDISTLVREPIAPRATAKMDNIDETAFLGSISMFGDSLTEYSFLDPEGPGARLSELCSRDDPTEQEVHVLDFGCAGQTSESLKGYFKDNVIDGYNARLPNAPPILVTIWLGANDAVLPPSWAHVPVDAFEANIKGFVEAVRRQPGWYDTKVLLITPPPINIPGSEAGAGSVDLGPAAEKIIADIRRDARAGRGHRTWQSKRTYAERIVKIAQAYKDEGVENVDLLDIWTFLTQRALTVKGKEWHEDRLPGSGLPGAPGFLDDWFRDGLHFGSEGYRVVTEAIIGKCNEIDVLARVLRGQ